MRLRASLNSATREGNYTAATGVGELLLEWEPTGASPRKLPILKRWPVSQIAGVDMIGLALI